MGKMGLLAAATIAASIVSSAPGQAALVDLGSFSGTDCGGAGGFPNCWATQTGVQQGPVLDPLGSPAVYKLNSDGSEAFSTLFPTIDGNEFDITYNAGTNALSFTYNQGTGDPLLHYFMIKQANSYHLWYDAGSITSGSIALSPLFPRNPGFSHITFFDTGGGPAVPEPATWAMMLFGFGAAGIAMRRSRRKILLAQVA
jgi:hypothetical protein